MNQNRGQDPHVNDPDSAPRPPRVAPQLDRHQHAHHLREGYRRALLDWHTWLAVAGVIVLWLFTAEMLLSWVGDTLRYWLMGVGFVLAILVVISIRAYGQLGHGSRRL